MTINKIHEKHILHSLIEGEQVQAELKVYTGDAHAVKIHDKNGVFHVHLRYANVAYIPENVSEVVTE